MNHKSYLHRFHRSESDTREDCGELDEANPPLFRKSHEDLRATLHVTVTEVRSLSWNPTTQLCGGKINPTSLREVESVIESDRK